MYGGGYDPILLNISEKRCYQFKDDDGVLFIVVDTDEEFFVQLKADKGYDGDVDIKCATSSLIWLDFSGSVNRNGDDIVSVLNDVGCPRFLYDIIKGLADVFGGLQYNDTFVLAPRYFSFNGFIISKRLYCYYEAFIGIISNNNSRSFDEMLAECESKVDSLDWTDEAPGLTMLIPNYGTDLQKNMIRYMASVFANQGASTYSLRKSGSPIFGRALIP